MNRSDKNFYFDAFCKGIGSANQAIAMVQTCFSRFDAAALSSYLEQVHKIEHEADEAQQKMMNQLAKEFLPPIEREDIVQLGHAIDNVVNAIEDILRGLYMYDVQQLRPEAISFVDLIAQCCNGLIAVGREFPNFRRSSALPGKLAEIKRIEEEADRLYVTAVHRLYQQENDAIQVMAWTILFDRLEKCCDCCEELAHLMEQVVLKNS